MYYNGEALRSYEKQNARYTSVESTKRTVKVMTKNKKTFLGFSQELGFDLYM